MRERLRVVVTGASGFLGRRLVGALLPRARVAGIDLLPRAEAYVPQHANLEWYQTDLAEPQGVAEAFDQIRSGGRVDAVVHLAAYYDFEGDDHPEYWRTNVGATRLVLEACRPLRLRRFVFASSVAACRATKKRIPITEESPPDGDHPYAVTKRRGEELLRDFAGDVPSVSVRLGALYSDWCEYPPLHSFLETWLSDRWNARALGGRGESSIPFLHVRDGVSFILKVLERMEDLDRTDVLIASEDGSLTHRQLFETATAYAFGQPRRPSHVPAWLAGPGLAVYDAAGRLMGERPFERPWMARYIDTHLFVDASRSRRKLGWAPHPRLGILKRVPFMIENRRTDANEWLRRNREAMEHHFLRPNYRVYRLLVKHQSAIAEAYRGALEGPRADPRLARYLALDSDGRAYQARMLTRNLMEAVRAGAKGPFMTYCRDLAEHRLGQGFSAADVRHALAAFQSACLDALRVDPDSLPLERAVQDYLARTIDFGCDQVLEVFEEHESGALDVEGG